MKAVMNIISSKVGQGVKFERVRRISGYLVGTTARWNNAKRTELKGRVSHIKMNGAYMNKYDLVRRLRKECGATEEEMEKLVKAMIDTFTEALAEGDRVFLPGLGTLIPVPRAERIGRNPKTGGSCTIPARTTVKFTAAKRLKDALNQKKKGYA